ncbi:uncharacterized protein LOC111086611 [Limulus polyphemus]|uniref:Uncharacterized protein LOC111086611 n=1 Tax=Limulus polyphemus TaxID=6850 RepID=A0ABM1SQD0_LIMPO|nr:uncharacterized protein LOC111086611 [Limulus polyphemus]
MKKIVEFVMSILLLTAVIQAEKEGKVDTELKASASSYSGGGIHGNIDKFIPYGRLTLIVKAIPQLSTGRVAGIPPLIIYAEPVSFEPIGGGPSEGLFASLFRGKRK